VKPERPDALQSEFDQLTDAWIKDEEKSAEIEQERAAIQDRLTEINDTLKTLC
jgi:CHASE3 domain sensor protein